tara:strand:+ start:1550 stop:2134 length:585 start_codon:yes stop_codon:yes gene_type:complete
MAIKVIKIFFIILVFVFIFIGYLKFFEKKEVIKSEKKDNTDISYNTNVIMDVNYSSKDSKGNEYNIYAEKGEIDFDNSNIVYLTNLKAIIRPKEKKIITVTSDFGKYNTNNFDTIFSKNVIIKYVENTITGDYLDFSMNRNSMIMTKNVVYSNLNNILKSDVIEMDLETKDIKIFMFENNKKVNIKSKNYNGNN